MGFLTHAFCLGVGYYIGKRYMFDYRVTHLHDVPNCSEFSVRVKESEHQDEWFRNFCHHHRHVIQPKQYASERMDANSIPTHKMENN